jgi:hypothetical protein
MGSLDVQIENQKLIHYCPILPNSANFKARLQGKEKRTKYLKRNQSEMKNAEVKLK